MPFQVEFRHSPLGHARTVPRGREVLSVDANMQVRLQRTLRPSDGVFRALHMCLGFHYRLDYGIAMLSVGETQARSCPWTMVHCLTSDGRVAS